jgi:capsular exopolysaccharide synthesis family protein
VDFKQIIQVLKRRWLTIALLFVIAVGAASAYTFTATKQYQSTAGIFVSADTRDATDSYAAQVGNLTAMPSYADLGSSTELMNRVIQDLDLNLSVDSLRQKVATTPVVNTTQINVAVTDPDPHVAQAIARSVSENLASYLEEVATPRGTASSQITARVTNEATLATQPSSPRTVLNLVTAALLGLVLGVGLAVARDVLDRTVRSLDNVQEVTSKPVLASVGFDPGMKKHPLLTDLGAFAARTEAFRLLRTNLQFLDLDSRPRSLVITSAVPGEGKTATATNLAVALAQAGRRVLLVDGDLRRPRVAGLLDLDGAVGLTTVLVGSASLEDAIQVHEASGLHFLASGAKPPNPTEILQSRVTHDLMARLRAEYDMVIVDVPPLLPVADAAVLATAVDGVLIVARHGKTTRDQLREAAGRIDSVGGRLFGIVINMIPRRAADSYYYYYYQEPPAKGARRATRQQKQVKAAAAAPLEGGESPGSPEEPSWRERRDRGAGTDEPRNGTEVTAEPAEPTADPSADDDVRARSESY